MQPLPVPTPLSIDSSFRQSRGTSGVGDSGRVANAMRPISPRRKQKSRKAMMMNQRTQRGAPPDTCLDHEW